MSSQFSIGAFSPYSPPPPLRHPSLLTSAASASAASSSGSSANDYSLYTVSPSTQSPMSPCIELTERSISPAPALGDLQVTDLSREGSNRWEYSMSLADRIAEIAINTHLSPLIKQVNGLYPGISFSEDQVRKLQNLALVKFQEMQIKRLVNPSEFDEKGQLDPVIIKDEAIPYPIHIAGSESRGTVQLYINLATNDSLIASLQAASLKISSAICLTFSKNQKPKAERVKQLALENLSHPEDPITKLLKGLFFSPLENKMTCLNKKEKYDLIYYQHSFPLSSIKKKNLSIYSLNIPDADLPTIFLLLLKKLKQLQSEGTFIHDLHLNSFSIRKNMVAAPKDQEEVINYTSSIPCEYEIEYHPPIVDENKHHQRMEQLATVPYFSPERLLFELRDESLGSNVEIYKKSAIWSLGCIFYQLINKELPPRSRLLRLLFEVRQRIDVFETTPKSVKESKLSQDATATLIAMNRRLHEISLTPSERKKYFSELGQDVKAMIELQMYSHLFALSHPEASPENEQRDKDNLKTYFALAKAIDRIEQRYQNIQRLVKSNIVDTINGRHHIYPALAQEIDLIVETIYKQSNFISIKDPEVSQHYIDALKNINDTLINLLKRQETYSPSPSGQTPLTGDDSFSIQQKPSSFSTEEWREWKQSPVSPRQSVKISTPDVAPSPQRRERGDKSEAPSKHDSHLMQEYGEMSASTDFEIDQSPEELLNNLVLRMLDSDSHSRINIDLAINDLKDIIDTSKKTQERVQLDSV